MGNNTLLSEARLPSNISEHKFEGNVRTHGTSSQGGTFEKNVTALMNELGALLISKHHDYGPKNISDSPYGPIPGLVTRIWDKLARILNLTRNNSTPNNESLEDSFADMANYAIISLLVLRGQWDVEQ